MELWSSICFILAGDIIGSHPKLIKLKASIGKQITYQFDPVVYQCEHFLCVYMLAFMRHACEFSSRITAVRSVIQVSEWQENLYVLWHRTGKGSSHDHRVPWALLSFGLF